jgi:hypothetical protein
MASLRDTSRVVSFCYPQEDNKCRRSTHYKTYITKLRKAKKDIVVKAIKLVEREAALLSHILLVELLVVYRDGTIKNIIKTTSQVEIIVD